MQRRILTMLIAVVALAAAPAPRAQTLTPARAMERLDSLPLHDIEGLWQLTAEGTTVAIWRLDPRAATGYEMVVVTSDDLSVRPGTRLGTLTPLAQPATFDARLATDGSGRTSGRTRRFTLKLEDGAHLSFRQVKGRVKVSPLAIFPHFLRRLVRVGPDDRPSGLDGAVKLYPEVPVKGRPRYL